MSEHAILAPSAAHRWIRCPGSVRLCRGLPDVETEYAAEGTFAHDEAAECLDAPREPELGRTSHCGRFKVDEPMIEALGVYLRAVRGTAELEGHELIQVEHRVTAIPDRVWGTADAIVWNVRHMHMFDLKFGAGIFVDVPENPQLMIYAIGALAQSFVKAMIVDTVFVHVVQPRHFSDAPRWRTWRITRRDLMAWKRDVLEPAVERTEAPGAPLVAGEHCRFCPAKATCPELRNTAIQQARDVFTPARTPTPPDQLDPEQIADLLRTFPLIETWMSAVRKHAYKLVEKERVDIPGFKLVAKQGHRKWRDESKAIAVLRHHHVDPYTKPKLISPAEAERRLDTSKKVVKPLVYTPTTGSTLVLVSDPRPALEPGAAFSVLTDEESD
jgi:hypothetical protein